jgi:hypothetical protein
MAEEEVVADALLTITKKDGEEVVILDLPYEEGDPNDVIEALGLKPGDTITGEGIKIEVTTDYANSGFAIFFVGTIDDRGGVFDELFPQLGDARDEASASKRQQMTVPITDGDLVRLGKVVSDSRGGT